MNIPPIVQTSFDNRLLNVSKNWVNLKDYQEIMKIVGFSRLGIIRIPGSIGRRFEIMAKGMPSKGGDVLRSRRYNNLVTL